MGALSFTALSAPIKGRKRLKQLSLEAIEELAKRCVEIAKMNSCCGSLEDPFLAFQEYSGLFAQIVFDDPEVEDGGLLNVPTDSA